MNSLGFEKEKFEQEFYEAKSTIEKTIGLSSNIEKGYVEHLQRDVKNKVIQVMQENFWEVGALYWEYFKETEKEGYLKLEYEKEYKSDYPYASDEYVLDLAYDKDGRPNLRNFFDVTMRHQCLLAAYDAVSNYYDALNDNWISAYAVAGGNTNTEGDKELEQSYIVRISNLEKHFEGYGFGKVFAIEPPKEGKDIKNKSHRILKSQQGLLYALIEKDGRSRRNAFSLFTFGKKPIEVSTEENSVKDENAADEKRLGKNVQKLAELYWDYLEHMPDITTADGILYKYRLESIFGVGLADEIYGELSTLKAKEKVCLEGISDMEILAYFSLLPNVFSRGIYAKYAIESLVEGLEGKSVIGKKRSRSEKKNEWNRMVEENCLTYTEMIFPMLQWSFLISLFHEYDVVPDNTQLDRYKQSLLSLADQTEKGKHKLENKEVNRLFKDYDELRLQNLMILKRDLKEEIEKIAEEILDPLKDFSEVKALDEAVKEKGFLKKIKDIPYESPILLNDVQSFLSKAQQINQVKQTNFSCPELSRAKIIERYEDKWFDPLEKMNDEYGN